MTSDEDERLRVERMIYKKFPDVERLLETDADRLELRV